MRLYRLARGLRQTAEHAFGVGGDLCDALRVPVMIAVQVWPLSIIGHIPDGFYEAVQEAEDSVDVSLERSAVEGFHHSLVLMNDMGDLVPDGLVDGVEFVLVWSERPL